MKDKTKSLANKLSIMFSGIVLIICLILVGTSSWVFHNVKGTMEEILYDNTLTSYKTEIKSEVQSAIALVNYYYNEANDDKLSEDDAKSKAKEALRNLRYDNNGDGYLWIDSTDYTLIMHPILSDQEGSNRKNLTDKNGNKIIQEIIKTANSGGGYNEFYFTKADGKTIAPKISYSEEFKEWGWVITTGVYTDDIQGIVNDSNNLNRIEKIFNGSTIFMIIEGFILVILMLIISYILIKSVCKIINKVKEQLEVVANGDLTNILEDKKVLKRNDELTLMVTHTNKTIESFKNSIGKAKNTANNVNTHSNDIASMTNSALDATTQIATAIEGIAGDATTQANVVNEVVTSMDNMHKNSNIMNDTIENIEKYINDLNDNSISMKDKVEFMANSSNKMTNNVSDISNKISETNHAIEQMSDILNSIEEIASKTNLLALNASIEAAHAGDTGRGFAVVANNIKDLAESTSKELTNIKGIINDLTDNFADCTNSINEVVKTNNTNVNNIKEVIDSFNTLSKGIIDTKNKLQEVTDVTENMNTIINNVVNQIDNVEKSAENTAAATEEVTASSEELTALMNTVNSNCNEMHNVSIDLVNDLNKFKI